MNRKYYLASIIFVLLLFIGTVLNASCEKKVPAAVDWVAGLLSLTPSQSGQTLPLSYSIPASGDSIVCKVVLQQVSPGDAGTITLVLKNIGDEGGDLRIGAILHSMTGSQGVSSSDIGVKLKNNGAYSLGGNSTLSSLESLVTLMNAQYRPLDTFQVQSYELEWQIAENAIPVGTENAGGTSQVSGVALEMTFALTAWPGND